MLRLKTIDLKKQRIDTLVVPVCEDKKIHDDSIINAIIRRALGLKEFKAEKGDELTLYDLTDLNTKRVIFAGLGKLKKIDRETLRASCGAIVKKCMAAGLEVIWVAVPAARMLKMEIPDVVEPLMEGGEVIQRLGERVLGRVAVEDIIDPFSEDFSLANFNHDCIVATWLQIVNGNFLYGV